MHSVRERRTKSHPEIPRTALRGDIWFDITLGNHVGDGTDSCGGKSLSTAAGWDLVTGLETLKSYDKIAQYFKNL